jgi:hypothetical protein
MKKAIVSDSDSDEWRKNEQKIVTGDPVEES